MTTITFSQTSLPPLVRVSNSADAPFSVSAGTSPHPYGVTVRVIGTHGVMGDTRILPEPEVRTIVRPGRRAKVARKKR